MTEHKQSGADDSAADPIPRAAARIVRVPTGRGGTTWGALGRPCSWCGHTLERVHQQRLAGALVRRHCDRCAQCAAAATRGAASMSGDVATRLLDAGYPIASGTVTVSGETIALGVTADRAPFGARERAAVAEWLVGLADDMTRADGLAEHDRVLERIRRGEVMPAGEV